MVKWNCPAFQAYAYYKISIFSLIHLGCFVQVNHELTNMIDKLKEEIMDNEDVPEESGGTDEAVEVAESGENAVEGAGLDIITEDGRKEADGKDDVAKGISEVTENEAKPVEDEAKPVIGHPTEVMEEDKPEDSDGANGKSEITEDEAKPAENEGKPVQTKKTKKSVEETRAVASDTGRRRSARRT